MQQLSESRLLQSVRSLVWSLLCFLSFSVAGCSLNKAVRTPAEYAASAVHHVAPASGELSMLSYIGGLASLFGIVALVITRGSYGMRAVIIGGCLIVLNFAVANFLSWLIVPVLIGSGCISIAWSYKTVRDLLRKRKNGDCDCG